MNIRMTKEEFDNLPKRDLSFVDDNGRVTYKKDVATRSCSCHPDDNPPRPCPQKHAYSECVAAANKINYRYNEDKYLEELKKYIDATYSAHYRAETNELQCIDVWFSLGSALTSCRDVIMKYLWRVGKKGSKEEHRKDLMKVMHYTMFALSALDRQKD